MCRFSESNKIRAPWKQNKDHNEHILIICPPNQMDNEIQIDEPSELIGKLEKIVVVDI